MKYKKTILQMIIIMFITLIFVNIYHMNYNLISEIFEKKQIPKDLTLTMIGIGFFNETLIIILILESLLLISIIKKIFSKKISNLFTP